MKLVIISGLSGSGKTVALHTLEDEDSSLEFEEKDHIKRRFIECGLNS